MNEKSRRTPWDGSHRDHDKDLRMQRDVTMLKLKLKDPLNSVLSNGSVAALPSRSPPRLGFSGGKCKLLSPIAHSSFIDEKYEAQRRDKMQSAVKLGTRIGEVMA